MEEKEQKQKDLEQFENQDYMSISTKINESIISLSARVEAANIITEILNSWLNVRQEDKKTKLPEKEIVAIQTGINKVNEKTNELFKEIKSMSDELVKLREKK